MEATDKVLVTRRMKGSGTIWGHSGGQDVLTLRSLELSGRFNAAWSILCGYWQKANLRKNQEIWMNYPFRESHPLRCHP